MLSSRPAPIAETHNSSVLGFDSLLEVLSFGALLTLLVLAPFELSGFWPISYDFWPQTLFLLLGAAVSLCLALSPSARPRFDAMAWCLLAFLGWNALSLANSVYHHDSWIELARVSGAFAVFFATRSLFKPQHSIFLLGAWCAGMSWLGILELQNFSNTHNIRQMGPFNNANYLANALAMTLPVALVFPVLMARWRRGIVRRSAVRRGAFIALFWLPFLLCVVGLIFTSSKGGLVAAFVGLLWTSASLWKARKPVLLAFARRHRLLLGGGGLLFLLIFGVLASKTILPRLQSAGGSGDNSTMFRVYTWRGTLDMAKHRPLLGHGIGTFPAVYPQFAQAGFTRNAHQSWLQIAAESGFPSVILLFAAFAVALRNGWRRLSSSDWPVAAGLSGAVIALFTHGFFDSGWSATSILVYLFVALALLTPPEPKEQEETRKIEASRLGLFWLAATLLLALLGYQTQKAANSEVAHAQSLEAIRRGSSVVALQSAQEAVALDSTSARAWSNLGRIQESAGGDGRIALETAAKLQPTHASNWTNLARDAERAGATPQNIEKFYARAVECDPLDSHLRLERATYFLDHKQAQGYDDLLYIVNLREAPYGRYPALAEWINLDFARATVLLVPHLRKTGQSARARELIAKGLADCDLARKYQAGNAAILREVGTDVSLNANPDLETVAAQLRALQTETK